MHIKRKNKNRYTEIKKIKNHELEILLSLSQINK